MSLKGYHEASLHPPAAYDAAAAATVWDWGEALVDRSAYMVDKKNHKKNHTSACCTFKRNLDDDGEVEVEMQVSLFMAPPPRVSYFCCSASRTDDDDHHHVHGEQEDAPRLFVREPWVIATEGDVALLALCHGYNPAYYWESSNYDYFVYEAPASPAGTPELTRLPRIQPEMLPSMGTYCFSTGNIGVVRYRSLIPKDDAYSYRIAAFAYDYFHPTHSGYYLCTYDSKDRVWIRQPAAFPQPPPPDDFVPGKVITIGGIMGWVDLWSGMVLCDVLAAAAAADTLCTQLHYLPLPEPRQPENRLPLATDIAYFFRDIALANDSGIIRFVDLQVHSEPCPHSQTPSGWTVVTWTLEGLSGGLDHTLFFRQGHEIHSRDIHGYNLPQSLFVSNSILSSHSDGVLYLLTNAGSEDTRMSQVIAVDLNQKKLLDVQDFDKQRPNPYMGTSISSYLMPTAVSKEMENMKRRAPGVSGILSQEATFHR